MKVARVAAIALFCSVLVSLAVGQANAAKQGQSNQRDMHGLIIYGEGFAFSASEPDGWDTDTGETATRYGANAIFFPRAQDSRSRHVNIRVRLNNKTDEDLREDMAFDVNDYKQKYPRTQFTDLSIKHPHYTTVAKLFYTANEFYEYVAYVNPGARYKVMFSVAMSKEKEPATDDELAAYAHVLHSLQFLTENVSDRTKP